MKDVVTFDPETGEPTYSHVVMTPEEEEALALLVEDANRPSPPSPWADFRSILPYLETNEDTRDALEVIADLMGG
jgi:hypothetical protein